MSAVSVVRPSMYDSGSIIWLLAIVASLSVHYVFLFYKNKLHNAAPDIVVQETITHVRFSSIAPPPLTVVEPEIEIIKPEPIILPEILPEPEPEPKVKPKPEPKPVAKPKPKPKKKVKPKPKKKIKPKPKPKKKVKPKPRKKPVKASVKKTPQVQPVAQNTKPVNKAAAVSPVRSEADQKLIQQTRKSYEALLRRHIEVHKNYPRVARKRKIQGKILVSFTLLADGNIKNLTINGKRSILKKATKKAIDYALPMPKPPKQISLPMQIKFYMDYFLK